MILLRITTLDLDNQEDHIATDWEVSDSLNFYNKLTRSVQDNKNLTSILFNISLDPGKKYYARARALLSTGYTEWSNIDIFTPSEVQEVPNRTSHLPSNISIPIISTENALGKIDPNSHDSTLFTIKISGFYTIGDSEHISTSVWIEDIFGMVVWSKEHSVYDLNDILFNNFILKSGKAYTIKAMFHSSSNDSSQISSYTIVVNGGKNLTIPMGLEELDPDVDNVIPLATIDNSKYNRAYWEIVSIDKDTPQVIWAEEVDNRGYCVVPAGTILHGKTYIIRVATDKSNNSYLSAYINTNRNNV